MAAFAVSGYSSTAGRTSKPFNPLLGETYELIHPEKGIRAIVEKVLHPSHLSALLVCSPKGTSKEPIVISMPSSRIQIR